MNSAERSHKIAVVKNNIAELKKRMGALEELKEDIDVLLFRGNSLGVWGNSLGYIYQAKHIFEDRRAIVAGTFQCNFSERVEDYISRIQNLDDDIYGFKPNYIIPEIEKLKNEINKENMRLSNMLSIIPDDVHR